MLGKAGAGLGVGSLVTAGALGVPIGVIAMIAVTLVVLRVLTMDPRLVDAFGRFLRKPRGSLGPRNGEGPKQELPSTKQSEPPGDKPKNASKPPKNPGGRRRPRGRTRRKKRQKRGGR